MSATTTGEAKARALRWTLWAWFRTGLSVTLLASVVVMAERFDAARATFTSAKTQVGTAYAEHLMPGHFVAMWVGIALFSTWLAFQAAYVAAVEISDISDWSDQYTARARAVVWGVAAIWSAWNLSGPAALRWTWLETIRPALHVASIALLIAALLIFGAIIGDLRTTWKRASIVRVQALVLGLLFVGVYVFPMTVGQAVDVFRAWADGSVIPPLVGVAGALLLGAAVRDSAAAFIVRGGGATPLKSGEASPEIPGWFNGSTAAGVLVLAAVIAAWRGWWLILGVVVVCLLLGVLTRRAEPPDRPDDLPDSPPGRPAPTRVCWPRPIGRGRRIFGGAAPLALVVFGAFWHARPLIVLGALALLVGVSCGYVDHQRPRDSEVSRLSTTVRLLGCTPLLVILLGLVGATVDSFLLPGASILSDWKLAAITLATGLVLAILIGFSVRLILTPGARGRGLRVDFLQTRWRRALVAVLFALVTFLAGMRHEWNGFSGGISVACAFGLAIGAALAAFARELGEEPAPGGTWDDQQSLELFAGAGASLGAGIAIYVAPVSGSRALGTAGITMLAFCGGLFLLHWAAYFAARREFRGCLPKWLPARVPVVTLLLIWALLADVVGPATLHQARTVSYAPADRGPSLNGLVKAWLNRQQHDYPGQTATMFLPAAAGGGSKVAFWTDLVLDCVMGKGVPQQSVDQCQAAGQGTRAHRMSEFFLGSGVSGGSVGLYEYLRHLSDVREGKEWVNEAAGQDDLSPIVGWGLFHDTIAYMLGIPLNPSDCTTSEGWCRVDADRAVAQEAAEAGGWHDFTPPKNEPLDTVPYSSARAVHGADVPFMVFNGSLDGAVGRFLMSGANLAPPYDLTGACINRRPGVPGALDAADVLGPGQQLPLVTAALLSARFPVVAPAGRVGSVTSVQTTGCRVNQLKPPLPAVRVRDGGYVENSGLLTIDNLLPSIEAAIAQWHSNKKNTMPVRVVVASVEDDSAVLRPHPKLTQQTSGANLNITARSGPDYLTRIARDELSGCLYPDVTYIRISPPPNVGAQAATGWQLSETARRRNLEAALTEYPGMQTLQHIRDLLDGAGRPRCQS